MEMLPKFDKQLEKVVKHGQGLRALVVARQRELEQELLASEAQGKTRSRADIEAALSALKGLMTGDLDQIAPVVAQELSQWLDTSKYIGVGLLPESAAAPPKGPQGLRARVEARQQKLEERLAASKLAEPAAVADLETGVTAIKSILAGDLDKVPQDVAGELSTWLDNSKSLRSKDLIVRPT